MTLGSVGCISSRNRQPAWQTHHQVAVVMRHPLLRVLPRPSIALECLPSFLDVVLYTLRRCSTSISALADAVHRVKYFVEYLLGKTDLLASVTFRRTFHQFKT